MEKRKSFKFKTNIPEKVKFRFSKPKTGKSEYGAWYLYGVEHDNNAEDAFFASPLLHSLIVYAGIKKGDVAEITLKEREDNPKSKYWILVKDGVEYSSDDIEHKESTSVEEPKKSIETFNENLVGLYWEIWDEMVAESKKRGSNGLGVEIIREAVTSIFIQKTRMGILAPKQTLAPVYSAEAKELAKRMYEYLLAESNGDKTRVPGMLFSITTAAGMKGWHKFGEMTNEEIFQVWRLLKKEVEEFEKATTLNK